MINWKKASKHTPTSEDAAPYISCIVWVCNPNVIQGGIMDMVRWDVKNNCWYKPDMLKWFYEPPYEITHFSSERNVPSNENFAHEPTKEADTEALNKHNVGGRSEQLAAFLRWYWKEVDGKPYEISAEEVVKQFGG